MVKPLVEQNRIDEATRRAVHWRRWGPYLSERQWGTVREDYSRDGAAWDHVKHDHARSRAYRWGEDGIGGICDNHQRLCFAIALWNGRDEILKERLFGLTGPEGNDGEDVKEYYSYLDSTPTHSYMKFLYKYPQAPYPYALLLDESRRRGRAELEFELFDTGVFGDDRYFDVFVEYAKATHEDVLIRITAVNRGPEPATLHLLPTLWYRNTCSWRHVARRPRLRDRTLGADFATIEAEHETLGKRWLHARGAPELLFTENETNLKRFPTRAIERPYVKDAFHEYVVSGRREAVNPRRVGTKAAAHYPLVLAPGAEVTLQLRLSDESAAQEVFGPEFDTIFERGLAEANEFYAALLPPHARRGPPQHLPPGIRRPLVGKAVLQLRRANVAPRRCDGAATAAGTTPWAELRLDSSLQGGRSVDARQVGVSVVCGLGPRISLRGTGARRLRFREAAAEAIAARMVHASERPDPRVRMGARRRQPAGARVGVLARLQIGAI